MNRTDAAKYAREAVKFCEQGHYVAGSSKTVNIADDLKNAVSGTVEYRADQSVSAGIPGDKDTKFAVVNDTTLNAALDLHKEGLNVAALNFASAKNPGGGFLTGARAQEESLCWSSALYQCLKDCEMYPYHRARHDGLYSHWVIYSPKVPVFRNNDALLEEHCNISFISSPAVNAGVVLRNPHRRDEIKSAMRERIRRVLSVALIHGHDSMVLGAWGCGVFRNDPSEIASLFHDALRGQFHGAFAKVVFAILDSGQRQIGPFEQLFS